MPWELTGNTGTDPANDFLGTTDNQPLVIRTNGQERIRIAPDGNVGIGTAGPSSKLHVVGPGDSESEDGDGVSLPGNVPLVAQATISGRTTIGILNQNKRQAFSLSIDNDAGTKDARGVPTFWDKYDGNWRSSISLRNGNVGIGTRLPEVKLVVEGGNEPLMVRNNNYYFFAGANRAGGDYVDIGAYHRTQGWKNLVLNRAGAGNVGIGTMNPQRLLQVGGDVAGVGFAPSDVSPNAGYVRWGDNTGWKLHFGRSRESSGGAVNTGTTGVLMTIHDTGQVGIGTTELRENVCLRVEGQRVPDRPSVAAIHSGGSTAGYSFASRDYRRDNREGALFPDGRYGNRWEWYAASDQDGRGFGGTTNTSSARLWSWTDRLYITAFGQMLLQGGLVGAFDYEVLYPQVLIGTLPGRPSSPPAAGELVLGAPRTSIRGFDGSDAPEDPADPKGMRLGNHWIRTNGNEDELWMAFSRFRELPRPLPLRRSMSAAVTWYGPSFEKVSDERTKTHVRQVEGALEKLERIRGVAFEWAATESPYALGGVPGQPSIGVVAQEVEEVFPELVSIYEPDQEYKAVDYDGLVSVLIEAVKELKAENGSLRARIEALERTQQ